ncbi:cadherin-like domain-containing protein [Nordella sp. HKS 07]|uniref:VCBS domain-containing protein n=1 Tax=Nordella sp. HKS 07 TaxID=2712222 RepID=UPI0013E19FE5|nr:VCBS domain-containing protein [Nordella sp. HKS 07]QIG47567.1 cadherin-like domain-containing protein [Nordella sp. HKS 07]
MAVIVDSNQTVVEHATTALRAAIDGSSDFASWVGWEYLQKNPGNFQMALDIVKAIDEGKYSLDDLFIAAQSKTGGMTNIAGEPDPTLKVLGQTFNIGHLLGDTTTENWTSGNAKNVQYHAREYFTSVDSNSPKGYVEGWENPNKAPVVSAGAEAVDEDVILNDSVAHYATDANNDALTFSLNGTSPAGLTFNSDGSYSFDATHASYQNLAAGEKLPITVNFTVDDGHGGKTSSTLTITVTGTNDKPIAVADVAAVNEDLTVNGSIANDSDVDHGAVLTYSLDEQVDGLSMDGEGNYSFNAGHDAYQYLAAGETVEVVADYTVSDGKGGTDTSTLTITVTGTNDAPVAKVVTGDVDENDSSVTVKADFKDVDTNDTHSFAVDTTGTLGSVTNNGDGTFSYDANGQFESLAAGESATDSFTYTVKDNNGAESTETATITIHGQNDGPTAKSWSVSANETDSKTNTKAVVDILKIDLLDGKYVSDVDSGDVLNISNIKIGGQPLPSYMKLDTDGHTLLVDLNSAALDGLHKGDHQLANITYEVSDGEVTVNNSVSLDIIGTADQYQGSVTAHGEKTAHNPSNGNDIEQKFSFDLHTDAGAFDFTNGKVTVVVQGDIDANNETAIVADVSSVDFTGFTIIGGGAPGQVDGTDPDNVVRSGFANVNAAALSDGHVDFDVTLSDKIDSDNHTLVDATLTYDYWA